MESNKIQKFVDLYFLNIPHSEDTRRAQIDIRQALDRKYREYTATMEAQQAFDKLIAEHNSLDKLAAAAGYPENAAQNWRSCAEVQTQQQVRKTFSRQKRRIYICSYFFVITLIEFMWLLYDLFVVPPTSVIWNVLIYTAITAAISILCYCRLRKVGFGAKCDYDAHIWMEAEADRYTKRKLNSIALLVSVFALYVLSELSFYFSGRAKPAEVLENVFANIIFVEAALFFFLKNSLCLRFLAGRTDFALKKEFRIHAICLFLISALYWLTVLLLIYYRNPQYPGNGLAMGCVVFGGLLLLYNLTLRKRVTTQNIVLNIRRIAVISALVIFFGGFVILQQDTWYTQTYINSVPVVKHSNNRIDYNEDTGVYTITAEKDDFKILHLTDIHLGGSLYSYHKDIKALNACFAEIEYTQPDLVVVTGDLCFPLGIMSLSLNNTSSVHQFAAFMRNTGIPWCFTYGNHDTEALASANQQELNEVYKSLSYKTSGTLLYPYVQPEITGRNNQLIEIRNADGSLNTALFLIDSNSYTGEGINAYDYIHDDQVEWYTAQVERLNQQEGHTVHSMAFFHIPLQEYRAAQELYESGSEEVTWFFGENQEGEICCSEHPSSFFDRIVELGSTDAVFCGHDHYNNMSLEYRGVRLTYGMSIDYLAMPGIENHTAQRGAELITLHSDGTWDLVQVPLENIR